MVQAIQEPGISKFAFNDSYPKSPEGTQTIDDKLTVFVNEGKLSQKDKERFINSVELVRSDSALDTLVEEIEVTPEFNFRLLITMDW